MGGQTHEGRLFHRTNYPRHLAAGKKATSEIPQPETSNLTHPTNPSFSQSTLHMNQTHGPTQVSGGAPMEVSLEVTNQASTSKKRDRVAYEEEEIFTAPGMINPRPQKNRREDSERALLAPLLTFSTAAFKIPRTHVQNISCIQSMFHVINDYLNNNKSDKNCRKMLEMERLKVKTALNGEKSKILSLKSNQREVWKEIPLTVEKTLKCFHLDINIIQLLCCPICFDTHGTPGSVPLRTHCSNLRFPSKTSAKPRITCRASLYKTVPSDSKKIKPKRIFYHQRFTEWLARMLLFSSFENSLDASISQPPRTDGIMADIWDATMWKTFKGVDGKIYTQESGNLVFGFFCDWFNPYGNSCARNISAGIMLMICYSLPPDIRYRSHNMFIYGITPGPREPRSEQMEPLLRPLLTELQAFWKGVHFTKTSLHPKGRTIRVALWPPIADVPAMKKISGFSAHSSTNFCSRCYITIDDIDIINHKCFQIRTPQNHAQEVQKWKSAPSAKVQQEHLKEDGVRFTIFSELPYWQPIEFPTIDIMHCLVLGLLRDLSITYLQIGIAGKTLQTEQENRHLKGEYSDDLPVPPDLPSDPNDPDKQTVSHGQSSDRTSYHRVAKSQTSSVPSHGLTPSSAASQASNRTLQPHSSEPSLTPHELQMVHRSISTTKVPSWLTRVPNQIGTARCGTPKAAEWLTLYSIYMVVSLIPYLHNSEPNSTSFNIHKALTLATGIINIAVSRTMTNQDISNLSQLLKEYRTHLRAVWPSIRSKPNLHYAQHVPDQIRRFGPPSYTAAWFGERTIGTLVQMPKNTNQQIVGQTMIKRHTLKTVFRNLCENTPPIYAALIGAQTLMKTGRTQWKPFTASPEISKILTPVLRQMGFIDIPKLESVSIWRHAGKSYSTHTKHIGNSRIEFKVHGKSTFGEIQHILQISSHPTPIFVINPFSSLTPVDNLKSPFCSLPYLHATVLYHQYQPSVAIPVNDLFGHIALVENLPGTLNISLPTLYVVSLRSLGIMDMTSTHTDIPFAQPGGSISHL